MFLWAAELLLLVKKRAEKAWVFTIFLRWWPVFFQLPGNSHHAIDNVVNHIALPYLPGSNMLKFAVICCTAEPFRSQIDIFVISGRCFCFSQWAEGEASNPAVLRWGWRITWFSIQPPTLPAERANAALSICLMFTGRCWGIIIFIYWGPIMTWITP